MSNGDKPQVLDRYSKYEIASPVTTPMLEAEEEDRYSKFESPSPGIYSAFAPIGKEKTAGARFISGVGHGIVHPVRAFYDPSAEGEDLGVAGTVGELVGAGLTFIPLYKGASMALTGVGLLKTAAPLGLKVTYLAPLGRTGMGLRGAQAAKGALAFAGFETFAGEDVSEAPQRFVRGLAEGVAFEAAFAGVAAAWRVAGPKWKPSGTTKPSTLGASPGVKETEAHVSGLRLNIEYMMRPGLSDSPEIVAAKLRAIGNPQEQLHEGLMTIVKDYMPGGQVVMPGLTQKEVTQLYKKLGERKFGGVGAKWVKGDKFGAPSGPEGRFSMGVFRRDKKLDLYDVLLVNNNRSILRANEWLGRPTPNREEFVAAIKNHYEELGVEFRTLSGYFGVYSPKAKPPRIQVDPVNPLTGELGVIGTLVHELLHHVHYATAVKRTGKPLSTFFGPDRPTLLDLFPIKIEEMLAAAQTPGEIASALAKVGDKAKVLQKLKGELEAATEEVVMFQFGVSRSSAKSYITADITYYSSDRELISRMGQLMLVNPQKAIEVAPYGVEVISKLLKEEVASVYHLMPKPVQVMADLLDDLWRSYGTEGVSIWERTTTKIRPSSIKEFNKFGWGPGMRTLVDGKDYEYLARMAGDRTKAAVRNLDTGAEEIMDMARLQRPILQNVSEVSEGLTKAVDGLLGKRPQFIPVNVEEAGVAGAVRRALIDTGEYANIGEMSISEWVQTLPLTVKEQLIAKFGQLDIPTFASLKAGIVQGKLLPSLDADFKYMDELLAITGHKGLMRDDHGFIELFVGDLGTFAKSPVTEAKAFGAHIAGSDTGRVFSPSLDDWIRQSLRTAGARESDVGYYLNIVKRRHGEKLNALMDQDTQNIKKNVGDILGGTTKKKKGKKATKATTDSERRATFYHGTNEPFTEFDETSLKGLGLSVTSDPKKAAGFAGYGPGVLDPTDPYVAGANIHSLNIKEGKFLGMTPAEFAEADKAARKGGGEAGKEARARYKEQGYTGIKVVDPEGNVTEMVVFDPDHVTSTFKGGSPIHDTPQETLARVGIETEDLADGRVMLRDANSKTILGKVADEDEAVAYANDLTSSIHETELGDFPGATNHGGNTLPPKPQDPVFPHPITEGATQAEKHGIIQRLVDFQHLFAPVFTALENFAKRAEANGLGPAYTKVYLPAHKAMMNVQRELSDVPRDALGGMSFKEGLVKMSDAMVFARRKRYGTITGHMEALSQEEIARAGGLMVRAMNPGEIRAAKTFIEFGLEHDVPRLMSTDRLITGRIKNRLASVIKEMEQIKLSPEAQELLQRFKAMPKFKTRAEVMDHLGLTPQERLVIKIIRDTKKADKDKFSIYAASRYASAPKLKKGFKNGQEQFAFENQMNARELKVSRVASELLEAGFQESGIDAKRHLSGYWPHMKVWVNNGFVPERMDLPPETLEWVAQRFRSGELNVYDRDPLSTVYRHLRGLYMKRHFDPVLPGLHESIRNMASPDSRVSNVMNEFVQELMGRPHASFEKLQSALSRSWFALTGKRPSERMISDIVNGLSAVTSMALIPFRPALIARNYFESMTKIAPRVGMSYYMRGLKYVNSPETRKEAYLAAKKAGAIRPGTQRVRSLHTAEELFGPTAPGTTHKLLRVFDKGFSWYQSADDWGRAIAYHSQRMRIMDNLDDLVKERISMTTFKQRSKITTFDPLDVKIAEDFIVNGEYNQAIDHLGEVLSREAMVRYGYADHPVGWNSVQGRLFGQFGTWPVQYKDYLLQGLTRGTTKDKAEFFAIHSAVNGSIIAAGASVGVNLKNWTGAGYYTGGPYVDVLMDVAKSLNGTEMEKSLAQSNLLANFPILGWMATGNPRSVFLPGSYFVGDMKKGMEAMMDGKVFEAIMSGTGVRVMRSKEESPLAWIGKF